MLRQAIAEKMQWSEKPWWTGPGRGNYVKPEFVQPPREGLYPIGIAAQDLDEKQREYLHAYGIEPSGVDLGY